MAKAGTGGETMRNSATALTRYLNDPDQAVRFAAFKALGSIGPNVVKLGAGGDAVRGWATALIVVHQEPWMRCMESKAAINALRSIGSSLVQSGPDGATVRASAAALLECLKDPDPSVRSAAAISLGEITPPRSDLTEAPRIDRATVMDALVEMLGDRDAGARRAAINAITSHPSGIDPPKVLAEGFKDESAQNRAAAVSCLEVYRQGLDPWAPILLQLAERDPDRSVREQCFNTLSHAFKPPAVTVAVVPVLAAGLKSKDAGVRLQLASVLSEFRAEVWPCGYPATCSAFCVGGSTPIGALAGEMTSPLTFAIAQRAGSRWSSAEAKEVIAALIEVAHSGPERGVGWADVAAADALGKFGPAAVESLPVLIKFLKVASADDRFNERHASVATAIGKIAPETPAADQAVAALLPVLESKDWQCRRAAVNALSKFGPRAAPAIPKLRALKDDHNHDVKTGAVRALLAIEDGSEP